MGRDTFTAPGRARRVDEDVVFLDDLVADLRPIRGSVTPPRLDRRLLERRQHGHAPTAPPVRTTWAPWWRWLDSGPRPDGRAGQRVPVLVVYGTSDPSARTTPGSLPRPRAVAGRPDTVPPDGRLDAFVAADGR